MANISRRPERAFFSGSNFQMTPKRKINLATQSGMTLWHRVQRSWPIVAVGTAANSPARRSGVIATAPSPRGTPESIKVDIEKIKQGSYKGHPAVLLRFEATIIPLVQSDEICFEIRLYPTRRRPSKDFAMQPHFGAYGPAHITGSSAEPGVSSLSRMVTIDMSETKRGILLQLRNSQAKNHDMPMDFRFALVVVHFDPVIVTVIPSMSDKRRARILQHTWLHPLYLDMTQQSRDGLETCARQGDDACHASCDDFTPSHLTTAKWTQLLHTFSLAFFDPNPAINVSTHHPSCTETHTCRPGSVRWAMRDWQHDMKLGILSCACT